jgi:hypothetical protein
MIGLMFFASQNQTLLNILSDNKKRFGSKRLFVAGDGAPADAHFRMQRAALQMIRRRKSNAQNEEAGPEEILGSDADDDEERRETIDERDDCASETDSSTSIGSTHSSDDNTSLQAGSVVQNTWTENRKPAKELSEDQAFILTSCMVIILGVWHCMQESIIANLDGNNDGWNYFARDWRNTEGRLKFLLSCGNVNDALNELFSAVCGMLKWWMQRYRKTNPTMASYSDFDNFTDREAEMYPALGKLKEIIEHTLITKCLYDSMRQGMLTHVLLLLEQLAELCAATGHFKYMR